jgi:hypothetical protein
MFCKYRKGSQLYSSQMLGLKAEWLEVDYEKL